MSEKRSTCNDSLQVRGQPDGLPDDVESCPACGALPCDWVSDPTIKQKLIVEPGQVGETEHTPTPWTLDLYEGYEDGTDCEILDKDGFPVATVQAHPILNRWSEKYPNMPHWADGADDGRTLRKRSRAEYEANAKFILQAVHSHDDLVAALRYLLDETDPDLDDDYNPHAAPRARAFAALAKAVQS